MVDNKNFNKIVYITNFGKKYHFSVKCQYIKGKEYIGIPLYEAKSKLEGACSKCANYNIYNINNPSINRYKNNNNNFNLISFKKIEIIIIFIIKKISKIVLMLYIKMLME